MRLSELSGLSGSLFPSPDWGISPSLFFQMSFQVLTLSFLLAPLWFGVGMFKVVLEVPKPLLSFLNSYLFILFWSNVYFFLLVQIVDLSPGFLPFTVGSLFILLYFTLGSLYSSIILQPSSISSVSILITSVLNCASDRLAISLLLSSIFGALICSFIWAIYLHLGVSVMF